jgi:PAS domain S-box-containing protein
MQSIPRGLLRDDVDVAARSAALRRLRELVGRDRASRSGRPTAGVIRRIGTGTPPAPILARARPAVPAPLRRPQSAQRQREIAGLLLAVLLALSIGALAVVASYPGERLPAYAGLVAVVAFGGLAVAVARLIARRQAAGNALAYSERRYRTLVEELPLVTYAARVLDSRLEYVSPQIERLLELTAEQALDEQDFWTPRLHPVDRDRVLRDWHAWCANPTAEPFRRTYRMLTESGRTIWVDDVTVLDGEPADNAPCFQRHLLDVSEQRSLEEQLREAQKFEALGRLAGGVAHDFNNLLAVIAGYSERLASRLTDETQRDSAVAIAAAADRGTALVRQLLSFSRPHPSDRRLVDLTMLVGEFVPLLRRLIGEDIELELGFELQPLPVEVDLARMNQVLMNLVVNARDAMPAGGRLTIATSPADGETGDDGVVRYRTGVLTVSDTGVGIDAKTSERIFEPFFTTKDPGQGTGLGLATAYGIVKQSGGQLGVSSTPGQGTTFTIRLPLAASDLRETAEPAPLQAAPAGGFETVLLVEDESSLRELEQLILEEAGYCVHAAADAAEALELARRHAFDLLVVDVVMPGLSGPQLVEELQARRGGFPTIFVSGYGTDEFASRGIDVDGNAVVRKPFHSEALLGKVRELLDRTTASAQRAHAGTSLIARCLACGARYRRTVPPSIGRNCCPRCRYVGWADTE